MESIKKEFGKIKNHISDVKRNFIPYTYLFKSKGLGTFDLVVETSAFKKWERDGLAAPFLNFIIYTSGKKSYSQTRYLK